MSKPRGTAERNQKLARLRHVVEIPVPAEGLGEYLSSMHSWALKRCGPSGYLESTRTDRDGQTNAVEYMLFHFPDAAVARDFAAAFGRIGAKVA
jgi:hypothetical protein